MKKISLTVLLVSSFLGHVTRAQGPDPAQRPEPELVPVVEPAVMPAVAPVVVPPAPPIDEPHAPEACRVQTVRIGWVSIACPTSPVRGARYVFRSQRLIRSTDPISGEATRIPSGKLTGAFAVERVQGTYGAGPIPRGSVVEVGDRAEPTSLPVGDNLVTPHLWPGVTRLVIHVAPFVPIDELGLGLILGLELEHRFRVPLVLGIRTTPIALALVRNGTGGSGEILAKVGYSSDYFEVAIEPGIQIETGAPARFALGYSVRFGAMDGLSLRFSNAYAITGDSGQEKFTFANAHGEAQLPLTRKAFLLFGGGGQLDSLFSFQGYVGTRIFLQGSGGPGTLLLSAALGAAGATYHRDAPPSYEGDSNTNTTIGPMLSAGLEARF